MFEIIESDAVEPGTVYAVPNIDGLTLVNGKLQVGYRVHHKPSNTDFLQYRDLTDDEKRRFAVLRNLNQNEPHAT